MKILIIAVLSLMVLSCKKKGEKLAVDNLKSESVYVLLCDASRSGGGKQYSFNQVLYSDGSEVISYKSGDDVIWIGDHQDADYEQVILCYRKDISGPSMSMSIYVRDGFVQSFDKRLIDIIREFK